MQRDHTLTLQTCTGGFLQNLAPDYSAPYVVLGTDSDLEGHGITFTVGKGNEIGKTDITGTDAWIVVHGTLGTSDLVLEFLLSHKVPITHKLFLSCPYTLQLLTWLIIPQGTQKLFMSSPYTIELLT